MPVLLLHMSRIDGLTKINTVSSRLGGIRIQFEFNNIILLFSVNEKYTHIRFDGIYIIIRNGHGREEYLVCTDRSLPQQI